MVHIYFYLASAFLFRDFPLRSEVPTGMYLAFHSCVSYFAQKNLAMVP